MRTRGTRLKPVPDTKDFLSRPRMRTCALRCAGRGGAKHSVGIPAVLEELRAELNSRDRHQHLIDGERKRGTGLIPIMVPRGTSWYYGTQSNNHSIIIQKNNPITKVNSQR